MSEILNNTRLSLFYDAAYLFPLSVGLLISPTAIFRLLGSKAEHANLPWRVFGALLLILAVTVVYLITNQRSEEYINTVIIRLVFVSLFSYLVGRTANQAYIIILAVLGFGVMWTLIALALDLRALIGACQR